jgi:hypothetical protein
MLMLRVQLASDLGKLRRSGRLEINIGGRGVVEPQAGASHPAKLAVLMLAMEVINRRRLLPRVNARSLHRLVREEADCLSHSHRLESCHVKI